MGRVTKPDLSSHASTHASGAVDEIAPGDIGGETEDHADEHGSGGDDPITPAGIGAAAASHSHAIADLPTKDEDDMSSDSADHVPTQQSVKKYVDDNAGSSDQYAMDMAGATESFKDGTDDTVTGLSPSALSGNLTDWTTLERSSSGIQAALDNDLGSTVKARLVKTFADKVPLQQGQGYSVRLKLTPTNLDDAFCSVTAVLYASAAEDEGTLIQLGFDGANRFVKQGVKRGGGWSWSNAAVVAGWNSQAYLQGNRSLHEQQALHVVISTAVAVEPTDVSANYAKYTDEDDTAPVLYLEFEAQNGSNMDVLIEEVEIVGMRAA